LPDGQHFLGESFGSVRRVMYASFYRHRFWGDGERIKSGQVFVTLCGHNYYHVMMEELPRALVALSLVPDACLVIYAKAPGFVHAIAEQVLQAHPGCTLRKLNRKSRVERLLLVSAQEHSGFTREELMHKVRSLFVEDPGSPAEKKLYLSRRWATDRVVENEDEIERLFRQNGFEVVYLERLALVQQWKLLNSARMVAGFSGAGMSNVLFCRPGTRVCCLFRPGDFIDCFARISMNGKHRYSYVTGSPHGRNGVDAEDIVSAAMKKLTGHSPHLLPDCQASL
jgi:capsular polysaccharide biosynthesis protein